MTVRVLTISLALAVVLLPSGPRGVMAQESALPELSVTADGVLGQLDRTLAWYQEARAVMRSVNEAGGLFFGREDEQTVVRILQRAFEVARAEAELLARRAGPPKGAAPSSPAAGNQRVRLEADIKRDEQELARLRGRAGASATRTRADSERAEAAAKNRLAVNRLRLDFITRLGALDGSTQSDDGDVAHRIQALQDAVPELRATGAAGPTAPPSPTTGSGTWSVTRRLLALQTGRSNLDRLEASTNTLLKSVEAELQAVRSATRPVIRRLRTLAEPPAEDGSPSQGEASHDGLAPGEMRRGGLAQSEHEFHDLLERAKLLQPVVVPLRGQVALLRRYATDQDGARRFIDRASLEALESLALQLLGLALAIAGILVGGVVWRLATTRYLANSYHRRLALATRNVLAGCAIALVVVFHFTSELTALVTALGFAAAGIAFALQNVILSVAGYFSMVAPNGIRIGDRVGLQGPFGYVHGEVLDIGLVRIRLLELAGEDLKPSGRIVVFPNAVVFTGSFYKGELSPHAGAAP